jgi:extracellular factor (EF) 3-hydroxypalmitic acid methyl ester biosynthesis protein
MNYKQTLYPKAMSRLLKEPDISRPDRLLDDIALRLERRNDVHDTMDTLSDGLWWLKRIMTGDDWKAYPPIAKKHPVLSLVHEDPLTSRSYQKPRGYPGDAPLLDLIYYDLGFVDLSGVSELGKLIFGRNKDTPAPIAVRERRNFIARLIDVACAERNGAEILCAACGHLREAKISRAVAERRFGRFVALDQDAESLAVVDRDFHASGIETANVSVKALLGRVFPRYSFDLIYAAGLYDYLDDHFAARLTSSFFRMLKPGGRLIVGNFVPGIYDVGYMEACMGWTLIYRDGSAMLRLTNSLPQDEISTRRIYTLTVPDIVYLEVRRRRTGTISIPFGLRNPQSGVAQRTEEAHQHSVSVFRQDERQSLAHGTGRDSRALAHEAVSRTRCANSGRRPRDHTHDHQGARRSGAGL